MFVHVYIIYNKRHNLEDVGRVILRGLLLTSCKCQLGSPHLIHNLVWCSHSKRATQEFTTTVFKGPWHFQYVLSICIPAKVYRVSVRGIRNRSSKMMRMLCLLAIAICLLPEQVATCEYCPSNSYWPRAYNRHDRQCGEGRYWVRDPTTDCAKKMYLYPNGHPTCGEGVWMRIGFFDMTQPLSECPSPLRMFIKDQKKYCTRVSTGCTSVFFDSLNQQYTEICGMVEAYQYGNLDAFHSASRLTSLNSDDLLEGIAITHKLPRRHLWSYVVGDVANPTSSRVDSCPCTAQGTTTSVPFVIGSDYYLAALEIMVLVILLLLCTRVPCGIPMVPLVCLAPLAVTIQTNLGSRKS